MSVRGLASVLAGRFEGKSRTAVAVEHRDQSISYERLGTATAALADELTRLGIPRGAHVGILADDTALIVPAMIGILANECVAVPLDPAHPPNHLRELVTAAAVDCLVVENAFLTDDVRSLVGTVLPVDARIHAAPAGRTSASMLLTRSTEQAFYVYFTSGTSGTPKPVLGRADSLLHFVDWEVTMLGLGNAVRVAQLTSPSHDPFLRDVFTPLVAGGTICLPDRREIVLSPSELGRWLDDAHIEVLHCTPTVFRNLLSGGLADRKLRSLRYVLLAGEQLRGAHLSAWYEVFEDRVALFNLYGPTETTLATLCYPIAPDDVRRSAIPIGRPIPGADVDVIGAAGRECPVGEIGELHIRTRFGTLGYYGRPDLTGCVFEPDPSECADGPVTYRTGDLVTRLADGNLEFVGRRDRQQKVRGKSVDLGRVEDEIIARTDIGSCVASAADEEGVADRLVLYYIADHDLDEQRLKRLLARDLPRSMVPDVWIRVDLLPTNTNGKLHDSGLLALLADGDQTPDPGPRVGPTNDLESGLLDLWRELLRNDAIGVDDAFIDVGGDSLTIMLLIARLDEEYGYELSLWDIFDSLTVRKLASKIDGGPASEG